MEKHLLTHRNLVHNEILLYSKHINSLLYINSNKTCEKNFIYESNNLNYLKKVLLDILKLT